MTEPLSVQNSLPLQQNPMSKSQAYKIQEEDVMPSKQPPGTVIEQVLQQMINQFHFVQMPFGSQQIQDNFNSVATSIKQFQQQLVLFQNNNSLHNKALLEVKIKQLQDYLEKFHEEVQKRFKLLQPDDQSLNFDYTLRLINILGTEVRKIQLKTFETGDSDFQQLVEELIQKEIEIGQKNGYYQFNRDAIFDFQEIQQSVRNSAASKNMQQALHKLETQFQNVGNEVVDSAYDQIVKTKLRDYKVVRNTNKPVVVVKTKSQEFQNSDSYQPQSNPNQEALVTAAIVSADDFWTQ